MPAAPHHFMYTHKAPMPIEGYIQIGQEKFEYDQTRDLAIMDEHKAFYPHATDWYWASFAGFDEKGRIVGLNITDNFTYSDQQNWNENGIWVGDKLSMIGLAKFDFDHDDPSKPWHITEENGRVDVEFIPDGRKTQKFNLLVASMDYYQQFGKFRGFIIDDTGEKHDIKNFYGPAEEYHTLELL